MVNKSGEHLLELIITEPHSFLIVIAFIKRLLAIRQFLLVSNMKFCHQFAKICLSILRIQIENLFTINIRF